MTGEGRGSTWHTRKMKGPGVGPGPLCCCRVLRHKPDVRDRTADPLPRDEGLLRTGSVQIRKIRANTYKSAWSVHALHRGSPGAFLLGSQSTPGDHLGSPCDGPHAFFFAASGPFWGTGNREPRS